MVDYLVKYNITFVIPV